MAELEPRDHLLLGLLTTDERRQAYYTNPHFKMTVDVIVAALPAWVDGIMADAAKALEAETQARQLMAQSLDLSWLGGVRPTDGWIGPPEPTP